MTTDPTSPRASLGHERPNPAAPLILLQAVIRTARRFISGVDDELRSRLSLSFDLIDAELDAEIRRLTS